MLTIIDYGVGNLTSIQNMLKKAGYPNAIISNKKADIAAAEKLILPGVGHFDYGMGQLRQADFFDTLNRRVLEDKIPVLGICLGAQLLTKGSEEGYLPGLGWIKAKTIRFQTEQMGNGLKVPHMGWGDISIKKESLLLKDLPEEPRFYFVHTYHIVCEKPEDELVSGQHGYEFTAGVERNNIMGVQFHPEKSHKYGLQLLKNFIQYY
ncbi:MAG: imidazole glycerol phosphate synthase subunit HisH [Saprospiraceae bacterium]